MTRNDDDKTVRFSNWSHIRTNTLWLGSPKGPQASVDFDAIKRADHRGRSSGVMVFRNGDLAGQLHGVDFHEVYRELVESTRGTRWTLRQTEDGRVEVSA